SSQLNSAVRAPPTGRYPVGEGAKGVTMELPVGTVMVSRLAARRGWVANRVLCGSDRRLRTGSLPREGQRAVQRVEETSDAQHVAVGDDDQEQYHHAANEPGDGAAASKVFVDDVLIADLRD